METNTVGQLLELIEEQCDVRPVTPGMTFEELGMDSLDYMCLIQEIRLKIGPISREQAQGCNCVADLLAAIS